MTEQKKPDDVICPACHGSPHPDHSCYCGGDGTVPQEAFDLFKKRQAEKEINNDRNRR